jgi:hypothetical protein
MKNIYCTYWIIFSIIALAGCSENLPKYTIINSDLEGLEGDYVVIENIENGISDTIFNTTDNRDPMALDLAKSTIITFKAGQNFSYVHLHPGVTIDLYYDQEVNVLKLKNDLTEENKALQLFDKELKKANKEYFIVELAKLPVDSFNIMLDKKYIQLEDVLTNLDDNSLIDSTFKQALQNRLYASKGINLLQYKDMYQYHYDTMPDVPAAFYKDLENVKLDQSLYYLMKV